jgi:very-short-patch-repair endonuclease
VRRSTLAKGDRVNAGGMPATSVLRTVGELCCRLSLIEAVVVADSALHSGAIRLQDMTRWAVANAGQRGIRNLRRVLEHAEPKAESPMESRLRMALVLAGLPRPKAQVPIHDRWGRVIGRPDLYYEEQRLGIEYDGATHRDSIADDNRRQNRLLNVGVRLLRFAGADVLGNQESMVNQVRTALATAGTGT